MANVILASPVISDKSSLSGSLAVGDMSLQNLRAINLYQKYRTEDLSAEINIDLGSAQAIDFLALIGHNATASGTIVIKAGSDDTVSDYSSSTLDLITGSDLGYDRNVFVAQITEQNYQYWRFELSDTGNPDGYLEIGRLYLSQAFQPEKNATYGMEEGYKDKSRVAVTATGGVSIVDRPKLKTAKWQLDFANKQEMYEQSREIDRKQGSSGDVLFVPDIDDADYFQNRVIYGRMKGNNPVVSSAFSIYRKSYEIEEIK